MKFLKYGLFGIGVLALLGVGAFVFLGMQSRNGSAPGLIEGRLSPCPASPNCVSSETGTTEDKRVDAFPLDAWSDLPGLITERGGEITAQDETYVSAEFASSLFGFVDDVEFRLTDTDIQVRSASRVGHSDAGVNRARVADLRTDLSGG
ncbi:MAG: DUF1499 domain-containing protein [Pseudomonadota bacterium]